MWWLPAEKLSYCSGVIDPPNAIAANITLLVKPLPAILIAPTINEKRATIAPHPMNWSGQFDRNFSSGFSGILGGDKR
jgi:hypothetical protein